MTYKKWIVLIASFIAVASIGYYLGFDNAERKNLMMSEDFNGTFSSSKPSNDAHIDLEQYYVAVSPYEKRYVIYQIGDEVIYKDGKCQVDDNIVMFYKDDKFCGTLVFLNRHYYWVDDQLGKQEVWRVSPGATLPTGYDF